MLLKNIFFFFIILGLFACNKEQSVDDFPDPILSLHAELISNEMHLNWSKVTHPQFESYKVVRSTFPLPNGFEPVVSSSFVVATFTEADSISTIEMNLPLGDTIFFTLFVDLGDRFIKSAELAVRMDYTVFKGRADRAYYNPTENLIYCINNFGSQGRDIYVFDVGQKEMIASTIISGSVYENYPFALGRRNGVPEVYIGGNSANISYMILDGLTLEQIKIVNGTTYLEGGLYQINEDYLAFKESTFQILNIDDGSIFSSFPSSRMSKHFFEYGSRADEYIELIAVSEDRLEYVKFKETGFIGGFKNIALTDELSEGTAISPDGNHFFAYENGKYYDKELEPLGQLSNGEMEFKDFAFSEDGTKVFALNKDFPYQILQYSFPELILEKEYPMNYNAFRIFVNQDQLLVIRNHQSQEISIQVIDF